MKYLFSLSLFICFLISACNEPTTKQESQQQDPNLPPSLTANENKGLKEIASYYSGEIHFDKGADSPQNRFFEVTLGKSEAIDKLANVATYPASNIATMMYKNLGKEAANFDEIHSILIFNDGKKVTTKFPTADLKIVANKIALLDKVVDLIKAGKYSDISPYINDKDLVKFDKEAILNNMKSQDVNFDRVDSFNLLGFKKNKSTDGRSLIQLTGYLMRGDKSNELNVFMDMHSDKEEILLMEYFL